MKPVVVNHPATITDGVLLGMRGNVVAVDSTVPEVWVELDRISIVVLHPDYIEQKIGEE